MDIASKSKSKNIKAFPNQVTIQLLFTCILYNIYLRGHYNKKNKY